MSYLADPAEHAVAVTKSDSTILGACRGLYIGGAGHLTLDLTGGETDVVFKNVQAGTVIPVRAKRVKAATTATDIVALS